MLQNICSTKRRLQLYRYGIRGHALNWIVTFVKNRKQFVNVNCNGQNYMMKNMKKDQEKMKEDLEKELKNSKDKMEEDIE